MRKRYNLLTRTNQAAAGMDYFCVSLYHPKVTNRGLTVNWLGSPWESKNTSIEGSQVPRSMKYLEQVNNHIMQIWSSAHRRVLNTTSTMTTKKLSARSACCDLLKERNITSIVLQRSRLVTSLKKTTGNYLQKDHIIVSERSEYPE